MTDSPASSGSDAAAQQVVHATAVVMDGWAVLLRGPSGAGKSDLALRLIERGASLIADDQTALRLVDASAEAPSRVLASCPDAIRGRIEVRGIGLVDLPSVTQAELRLLVDLVPADMIGRLPERTSERLLGTDFPVVAVTPFEASAPLKLRLALRQVTSEDGAAAVSGGSPPGASAAAGPRPVVVITGMSGAGRSVALRALEDGGYEAVDNLPLPLLDTLLSAPKDNRRPIALGVDIRSRDFAAEPLLRQFDHLAQDPDLRPTLVFVDCDDEVLMRRFKETRRRHPLAEDRPIGDGLAAERRMLAPLRDKAQVFIDTSALTPAAFRRQLLGQLGLGRTAGMAVFVTSFSYRHGIPREADLVFDVRFLANPHYRDELRPLTGQDTAVQAFVVADRGFAPFFDSLTGLLGPLLPRYRDEGKSYLTLAVGCTGGRHRSVTVAERLAVWVRQQGFSVHLEHRDSRRDAAAPAGSAWPLHGAELV